MTFKKRYNTMIYSTVPFFRYKAIMTDILFKKMTNILAEEIPKDPRKGKKYFDCKSCVSCLIFLSGLISRLAHTLGNDVGEEYDMLEPGGNMVNMANDHLQ
jgi:hypothetical protein